MGPVKKVVAGAVIAGSGFALEKIGELIFSVTGGSTAGPVVDYHVLMELSSTGLILLGGAIALYGLVELAYRLWKARGDESGEDEPTSPRSRSAPSSRRDRPRSPSRS